MGPQTLFRRRPSGVEWPYGMGEVATTRTAAALALFFLAAKIAPAQSHAPALRVEVNLQPVEVQVKDARGNDISGLSANDFTVLENGQPQKIAFFDAGSGPVTLAILVDSSSSMNSSGRLGSAAAIADQFMRTARPGDEIWGMDFSDQMGPFQQLAAGEPGRPAAINLAPAPSHGSALYDATATALCHLRTSKNLRQAVIVISDGVDEYSRLSLDQLIGLVRSSRAQLFMIGLQSLPQYNFEGHAEPRLTLITGHDIDNPVVVFHRLMTESGTESFIPKSQSRLEEALKAVLNFLESEYTLAYYPHGTSRKLRKIAVKVDRHGARVMARQFVASEADAWPLVHFDQPACTVSPQFHPYPYEAVVRRGPGGIVYREDFSDHQTGWPAHADSHYVSGGYELSNLPAEATNVEQGMRASGGDASSLAATVRPAGPKVVLAKNVIAAYGPWWSNFSASVTVKLVPAPESPGAQSSFPYAARPAAGLVFRMNVKGYYALLVSSDFQKKQLSVEVVRRDFLADMEDYTGAQIIGWTAAGPLEPWGTNLSVEDVGSQISILADGREIKTAHDSTYGQGFVGLMICGPGQATFKNLVVEQSSPPSVPLSGPSADGLSHQ